MLVPNEEGAAQIPLSSNEFTIGRSARCSHRIKDNHISGTHLRITIKAHQSLTIVTVVDLSSNGTFLNQVKVGGAFPILKRLHLS